MKYFLIPQGIYSAEVSLMLSEDIKEDLKEIPLPEGTIIPADAIPYEKQTLTTEDTLYLHWTKGDRVVVIPFQKKGV